MAPKPEPKLCKLCGQTIRNKASYAVYCRPCGDMQRFKVFRRQRLEVRARRLAESLAKTRNKLLLDKKASYLEGVLRHERRKRYTDMERVEEAKMLLNAIEHKRKAVGLK